jgi:hypothetical protein
LQFEEYRNGKVLRQISVVVGFSFWEAEEYVEVCEHILEVC